ncbi:hypothetical protein BDY19DRAFT_1055303 [Irpex rosettiformis]|uniref:Uncharacterized protein n=1 Tax=Irpex rosettiformis TaxID=378272 RepID=A0ACB8UA75_9APHY|nr:hypothetical protein BDY19DRAFT_1055303 [Irpex rosettiformis]
MTAYQQDTKLPSSMQHEATLALLMNTMDGVTTTSALRYRADQQATYGYQPLLVCPSWTNLNYSMPSLPPLPPPPPPPPPPPSARLARAFVQPSTSNLNSPGWDVPKNIRGGNQTSYYYPPPQAAPMPKTPVPAAPYNWDASGQFKNVGEHQSGRPATMPTESLPLKNNHYDLQGSTTTDEFAVLESRWQANQNIGAPAYMQQQRFQLTPWPEYSVGSYMNDHRVGRTMKDHTTAQVPGARNNDGLLGFCAPASSRSTAGKPVPWHGRKHQSTAQRSRKDQPMLPSTAENADPIVCDTCKLQFRGQPERKRHQMSVHEKVRSSPCTGCDGRTYTRRDALIRHIKKEEKCLGHYKEKARNRYGRPDRWMETLAD